MELFTSCSGASRNSFLEKTEEEILLFVPNLEACADYAGVLIDKANSGAKVKVLVRQKWNKSSELYHKFATQKVQIKSLARPNILRNSHISKSEVWILDKKLALISQPLLSDQTSLKIAGDDVRALADYFFHHWDSLRIFRRAVSYLIRHKKFSLSTGRGCLRELLQSITSAETGIFLSTPWPSKKITQALLLARKRGVNVTLFTSRPPRSPVRLRWFFRSKVLREAGVEFQVYSKPSLDFLGCIDQKVAFFGNSHLDFFGRHRMEVSFAVSEPQICSQLSNIIKDSNLIGPHKKALASSPIGNS